MRNRFGQRFVQLIARFDELAHPATGAGKTGKARINEARLPDFELRGFLLLRNFAELGIVHQHMGDVHPVFDRGGELHGVLAKAAIA